MSGRQAYDRISSLRQRGLVKLASGGLAGLSRKCLLETGGRCYSWFVAFRSPCGTDSKVPAAGVCQLAYSRKVSRSGFATVWLKRGSSTNSP
jgi:hypothetical protein